MGYFELDLLGVTALQAACAAVSWQPLPAATAPHRLNRHPPAPTESENSGVGKTRKYELKEMKIGKILHTKELNTYLNDKAQLSFTLSYPQNYAGS